jgi:hypothetical protein
MPATVIPFPTSRNATNAHTTDADRFVPVTDLAEMARWSTKAARARYYLQEDLDPDTGEASWIAAADNGAEYIGIAIGSPHASCSFMISVQSGRYVVAEIVGEVQWGNNEIRGTFDTLRDALEDILLTLPEKD